MRYALSRSLWPKLVVTVVAIVGFVLLYEVGMFEMRDPAQEETAAGTRYIFTATAYCKGTTTASGVGVRTGIAAADPAVLPVGSVISITAGNTKYSGIYTVMDTGPNVQGRLVDLYMWSCNEALAFGRQEIELTVLRLGWHPSASTPGLIDRLFRRGNANGADGAEGTRGAKGASERVKGASGADVSPAPSDVTLAPSDLAPSDAPLAPSTPSDAPVAPVAPSIPLAP